LIEAIGYLEGGGDMSKVICHDFKPEPILIWEDCLDNGYSKTWWVDTPSNMTEEECIELEEERIEFYRWMRKALDEYKAKEERKDFIRKSNIKVIRGGEYGK